MSDRMTLPGQAPAILLVDDEVNILRAVDRLMVGSHLRMLTFSNPTEALPALADPSVVVIVSDFRMPLYRGTDVLARAQKDNRFARRILLTAYADLETGCEAITGSCIHQFITKPYEPSSLRATLLQNAVDALFDTLIARIPLLMRSLQACTAESDVRTLLSDALGVLGAEAPRSSLNSADVRWNAWGQSLRKANVFPEREDSIISLLLNTASMAVGRLSTDGAPGTAARVDPVTNLLTPAVFSVAVGREEQRALRYRTPLSVALLEVRSPRDADHGNGAGDDAAARAVAEILRRNIRSIDVAARRGSHGFAVLFPGLSPRGAALVMKRIVALITAWAAATEGREGLAAFVGISEYSPDEKDEATFVSRADSALDYAQKRGPGGIAIHDQNAIVPC